MDGEPNAADSRVERLLNLALRAIRNQTCQASRYHVIAPRGMGDSEQVAVRRFASDRSRLILVRS